MIKNKFIEKKLLTLHLDIGYMIIKINFKFKPENYNILYSNKIIPKIIIINLDDVLVI